MKDSAIVKTPKNFKFKMILKISREWKHNLREVEDPAKQQY